MSSPLLLARRSHLPCDSSNPICQLPSLFLLATVLRKPNCVPSRFQLHQRGSTHVGGVGNGSDDAGHNGDVAECDPGSPGGPSEVLVPVRVHVWLRVVMLDIRLSYNMIHCAVRRGDGLSLSSLSPCIVIVFGGGMVVLLLLCMKV